MTCKTTVDASKFAFAKMPTTEENPMTTKAIKQDASGRKVTSMTKEARAARAASRQGQGQGAARRTGRVRQGPGGAGEGDRSQVQGAGGEGRGPNRSPRKPMRSGPARSGSNRSSPFDGRDLGRDQQRIATFQTN
jgi:hypothetical protein